MSTLSTQQQQFLKQSHLSFIEQHYPQHFIINTEYSHHTNNYYTDLIIPNQPNTSTIIQSTLTKPTQQTPLTIQHFEYN